ncbi:MAG: DMT family transporter [Agathobaculum butyriciproducens]|nr:DMT family transporter [Agathobaculum butyriciproducens]
MQSQRNDKTTYLLLALTTVLWGSLYTASKVLLDVIQPFTLLCLRYIIAAIAMTILQRLRKPDPNGKPRRIKGGDWKYVIMFGLGGYVLSIGLQQYGTKLAGASLASLINCMNPIAICFFAVLLLHERMTMKKVVCIVSAVAGAVCIVGGDAGGGHLLGIALSLGSVLTWSALSVFMRSFSQKYDALTVTTCGIYVAAIGTLPLMLREIITHPEMDFLHAKYILGLFYVAIFCTTIPHSLWNYCLSRAEASTCSLFYPI